MKRNIYLIMLFLSLAGFRNSSNRNITGTVYSKEDNRPLSHVNIFAEGSTVQTSTDQNGRYSISVAEGVKSLRFSVIGYQQQVIKLGKTKKIDVWLKQSDQSLTELVVTGYGSPLKRNYQQPGPQREQLSVNQILAGKVPGVIKSDRSRGTQLREEVLIFPPYPGNTESYKGFVENAFLNPGSTPLSTFAIDVDAASYSNARRMINRGTLPTKDAIRIEEMINYFHYDMPAPPNEDPVAIHTELSAAPWNTQHRLLRIGLKAKSVKTEKLPPSNFVFLIDVSGSMEGSNRLPLVKSSMKLLIDQLRDQDHVAIVTYAGAAGLQLPSTSAAQKMKIRDVIDNLGAGGSTAGAAGIRLAYQVARQNFIKGGNNRIILASDGDFNVGATSDQDMESLIVNERKSGVSLSVLGFGMGNYKDSKMETLADKGHGNYAYIDNIAEARKAMVTEFGATLFTVAKDVKIQVEFNPGKVQAYRLIGYENRLMEKEDFNDDQKIGGDMGVGHTVTALYEIIPAGVKDSYTTSVDPLKYQSVKETKVKSGSQEMATVKFRFKTPEGSKSKMTQVAVVDKNTALSKTSADFRFATSVAELGMLLRDSEYKQNASFDNLINRAKAAKGADEEGYRAEFINLAQSAKLLSNNSASAGDTK
ncbi:von Willebrand factor type A domain-containing protein [Pedobacter sp. MC2016-15]|uniref:vWA domain-containing protein n=1 Tax=Pedobacter sp. MC2016-15 TaxID=2994473 RepID=UPI0022460D6A|nr:von Willebrand factor type A domain-containing protein [Pedobacter sp. MC2016-15]MCX2478169.1 von Willebrand factor type A domain-containing protein [Pedobacter sp. MC2016-15]